MFIKTLTTNDKYFLGNSENLPKPIQMQLSKKKKCCIFAAVLKFTFNFKSFKTKGEPHILCISEITDGKIHGLASVKKALFLNTLQQSKC